jgi:hypothetical protein
MECTVLLLFHLSSAVNDKVALLLVAAIIRVTNPRVYETVLFRG